MLSAHYRTQLNFTSEILDSAKASMERLYNAVFNLENLSKEVKVDNLTEGEKEYVKTLDSYREKYIEKMDDDFNTADGISTIFDLVRDVNTNINAESSKELVEYALGLIRELGKPLGILENSTQSDLEAHVEKLIEDRQRARKERNWALADQIRDDLKAQGIILEDTPQGVRWHLKND